ncbi:MAG TPA: GNAT family N-acetyltransferase [Thermomicrobiales bacterium]|nr:GNAT family N-acetyltransferase [Thermomicrobiales bacterium]
MTTIDREVPAVWHLTEQEVPVAAQVLTQAFATDAFFRFAIPDQQMRMRHLPPFFAACLRYGLRYGQVYAAGRTTDTIEGVGWWYRYPDWQFNQERTSAVGFDAVAELLAAGSDRITGFAGRVDAQVSPVAPEPRANLDQIGVLPDAQGHGIGRALLQEIIADATAEALPVCLWTVHAGNLAFYTALGFHCLCSGRNATNDLDWWAFLRVPD